MACVTCCEKLHASGSAKLATFTHDCLCTLGVCGSQCAATYCAMPPQPTDGGCVKCIGASGCGQRARDECAADVECTAYAKCQLDCP